MVVMIVNLENGVRKDVYSTEDFIIHIYERIIFNKKTKRKHYLT